MAKLLLITDATMKKLAVESAVAGNILNTDASRQLSTGNWLIAVDEQIYARLRQLMTGHELLSYDAAIDFLLEKS